VAGEALEPAFLLFTAPERRLSVVWWMEFWRFFSLSCLFLLFSPLLLVEQSLFPIAHSLAPGKTMTQL
jgi:hypothetical protein